MRSRKGTPEWARLAAAVVGLFGWEFFLDSQNQPFWRQGVVYIGEMMFGFTLADLIWYAVGRQSLTRWQVLVSAAAVLVWPLAIAVAALTGLDRDGCAVAAAALTILARLLTTPQSPDA